MKRLVSFMIALMALLSFAACQATPETPLVVGKDQARFIEESKKDTIPTDTDNPNSANYSKQKLSEQYGIPNKYDFTTSGAKGKLQISVSANVNVPDSNHIPIYRVEKVDFDQSMVSAFYNIFCGDAQMYDQITRRTKKEIELSIIATKRALQNEKDETVRENMEQGLVLLEKEYKTAPDTIKPELSDGKLRNVAVDEGIEKYIGLHVAENYDKGFNGIGRAFGVANNASPDLSFSDFRNPLAIAKMNRREDKLLITDEKSVDASIVGKIGLSPTEARQKVQDILDKTNCGMIIDNMHIANFEKPGNSGVTVSAEPNYSYKITCVRRVDGYPCSDIYSSSEGFGEFGEGWRYEEMTFYLDGQGVFNFEWYQPIKVIEIVNDDAKLKTFEEIKSVFEKMMIVKHEARFATQEKINISINRVDLSLHRIIEQNAKTGLLIPAWNFYGTENYGDNPEYETFSTSLLTINAVDGSIIDTAKGY